MILRNVVSIVYKLLGPTLRYHIIILYIADESSILRNDVR